MPPQQNLLRGVWPALAAVLGAVACVLLVLALLDSNGGLGFEPSPSELKVECYTFNGQVSCSSRSIKKEHKKGNTVVKVLDNPALKNPEIIGPTVRNLLAAAVLWILFQ